MRRAGGWALNVRDIYLIARTILQGELVMIGHVAKQYGPFRLHRYAISLRCGGLLDYGTYCVILGALPVPVFIPFRRRINDPEGMSRIVRDRIGPFQDCVYLGEIRRNHSTYRDLHDKVDRWLKNDQTSIDCFYEQVADEPSAPDQRKRVQAYRNIIAKHEARQQVVREAFQAFLNEYPDAAVGAKNDAAADSREARRVRRGHRALFKVANRMRP
jgi:hypothetical protein